MEKCLLRTHFRYETQLNMECPGDLVPSMIMWSHHVESAPSKPTKPVELFFRDQTRCHDNYILSTRHRTTLYMHGVAQIRPTRARYLTYLSFWHRAKLIAC